MKVTYELDLGRFEAWSGGEDTLERILDEGMESNFESLLEELYPDGIDETTLNDLLRFESDWIYESLGMMSDEEKEAREEVKDAIEDFDDTDALCEHYDGDCVKCPLCRWSYDCSSMFDELKEE